LLNDIKTKQLNVMDMFREWKREDCQKEEENEVDLNLPGRKGLED
jgi:hypothetical protein